VRTPGTLGEKKRNNTGGGKDVSFGRNKKEICVFLVGGGENFDCVSR